MYSCYVWRRRCLSPGSQPRRVRAQSLPQQAAPAPRCRKSPHQPRCRSRLGTTNWRPSSHRTPPVSIAWWVPWRRPALCHDQRVHLGALDARGDQVAARVLVCVDFKPVGQVEFRKRDGRRLVRVNEAVLNTVSALTVMVRPSSVIVRCTVSMVCMPASTRTLVCSLMMTLLAISTPLLIVPRLLPSGVADVSGGAILDDGIGSVDHLAINHEVRD